MDNVNEVVKSFLDNNVVKSIIVVLVSLLVYKFIQLLLKKAAGHDKTKNISKKGKTYMRLSTSILRYVFLILTILILLQINGVDVSSLLAGLGIASVIIGLAVQDALKDIIRGFTILSDTYFQVGDIVRYNGMEGKVIVIGLRSTKIQDIATGNIVSIANRNIEFIEVVSEKNYINIPMPYETSLEKAEKAVKDILDIIIEDELTISCRYLGVNKLDDSSVLYLIEVCGSPEKKLQLKRNALRAVMQGLAKNNIEVPFNQIDVHNK